MILTYGTRVLGKGWAGGRGLSDVAAVWRSQGGRQVWPHTQALGDAVTGNAGQYRYVGLRSVPGRQLRTRWSQAIAPGSLPRSTLRAFGSPSPAGSGAESLAVSANLQAFIPWLSAVDRQRLAAALKLDPDVLAQVARTGRAQSAAQAAALQDPAVLDSLLCHAELEPFVLACRFIMLMAQPGEAVLERLVDRYNSSPLMKAALRLCAAGHQPEPAIKEAFNALDVWIRHHRLQPLWHDMMALLLEQLAVPGITARLFHSASQDQETWRQVEQARELVDWLLHSRWQGSPGAGQHRGSHYRLRRALDSLVESGGGGSRARAALSDWYKDWLALESVYSGISEPELPDAGNLPFADWWFTSYGGQLSGLERALARPVQPGGEEDRPPNILGTAANQIGASQSLGRTRALDKALEQWLRGAHPADSRLPTAGLKRPVLLLGGLCWRGGQALPVQVQPALESILSREPDMDAWGRDMAWQLLQWAFCHCLYTTVAQHDSRLLMQVPYVSLHDPRCAVSGLECIRSREQLTRRLLLAPDDMQLLPLVLLDKTPLRTLLAEPDALVLDSLSILILAQQFLASVDTDVFWQAHGETLRNL